jgi:arylsulfatase A-like enzyme
MHADTMRLIDRWLGVPTCADLTIENLDTQIRRVLVETGLAVEGKGGDIEITAPDTLIVVVGDNGSFLTTVKYPFNPLRSKASPYQTGVCVPLVVAGGPTAEGGRAVDHMVNIVDFYELWGEAAGIDVRDYLPDGTSSSRRPSPVPAWCRDSRWSSTTSPSARTPTSCSGGASTTRRSIC